ncbi:MAG: peptidase domain-containing ABC transporter [bacterium]
MRLPQQFFDSMRSGEIISRLNDAIKIRSFINEASISFILNCLIVIFSFSLMFIYHWKLALILLTIIPMYAIIYYIYNKLNKKVQRKLMEDAAEVESQLVDSLKSVFTIKSFGLQDYASMKIETRFVNFLNGAYKSSINSVFAGNSSQFIARIFIIIMVWVGAGFVLKNEITPGELLSFYAILGYLTGPVGSLINMNRTIQDAFIASDRLFELMDLENEPDDEKKLEISRATAGDIRFENVVFRYGSRATVFNPLNMNIPYGKVSAIIGPSGSGKTTLISILQKLYPIQEGRIYIGKYDINYISNESLRTFIVVVPQKVDLFTGNVVENIAVGEFEPDMEKIVKICTSLGMMEFIENLPNGFLSYLGENGVSLSGGERQRIAIARAMYMEPEILILDEATSALDSNSEEYVQKMIKMLKDQGKTVIIIAHRLSTILNADRIFVLDKGILVEEGVHEKLIRERGAYFQMLRQQYPLETDFSKLL